MKKIFLCLLLAGTLSSCSVMRESTTTVVAIDNTVTSRSTADLTVGKKVSYTYYPTKMDRKAGLAHVVANATAAALKANGDADVLVQREYECVVRKTLLGRKLKSVTITGYPATYENFQTKK